MRANLSLRIGGPSTVTRLVMAFVATWFVLLLGGAVARADDLLLLNGDSITLSGSRHYGFVYVDGAMRLDGDTSISASPIYIGPNAYLAPCFVAGVGDGGCRNGRSLSLSATGRLTVSSRIDLTGGTGRPRSGGNLGLSGNPVTVGGDITTAGESGGASGQVMITSGGALSTGGIYAPSAPVSLTPGGAIDVAGDIDTYGTSQTYQFDPTRVQAAAPVTLNSRGGDVRVEGNINAGGRDAPSAVALNGGNGAPVAITGTNVRTGAIDVTGGSSQMDTAGYPSTIQVTARGELHALGRLDASGQNSTVGAGTPGNRIMLSATGPLTAAGGAHVDGATGPGGGSAAGLISLTGAGVTTGDLTAQGGNAPNVTTPPPAGPGGSITVTSSGGASLGSLLAQGGNAYNGGIAGHGGAISVSAGFGPISTADVQTHGGYTSDGPGIDGGAITLSALGDLTVGGTLDATGSDANGAIDPPRVGGNAGNVVLRAVGGTLSLDAGAYASGGRGSDDPTSGQLDGRGGRGGRVDVITRSLGPITTLSSAGGPGGSYGADQGPGGAGGPIFAWTDAALFDSQKVVDSDGGDGNPTGPAGGQHSDGSPAGLTESGGRLSFISRSPDAQAYRLLKSIAGGASQTALQTTSTSGLRPNVPTCVPVTFTVVAFKTVIGWTSDPSAPVAYVRPPSATQGCHDAPRLSNAGAQHRSLKRLRRAGWHASVSITTSGVGTLKTSFVSVGGPTRTAKRGKHKAGTPSTKRTVLTAWSTTIGRPGRLTLRLQLPPAARHAGTYELHLVTTSPDGKRHATTNLILAIGP